jgi:hypothetical protein
LGVDEVIPESTLEQIRRLPQVTQAKALAF